MVNTDEEGKDKTFYCKIHYKKLSLVTWTKYAQTIGKYYSHYHA